jgi:hypothetical protein
MINPIDCTIIMKIKQGNVMFEAIYCYQSGSWNILSSFQWASGTQR